MFIPFNLSKNFDYLVRKRYSCRTFNGNGVENEKISEISKKLVEINEKVKNIRFGIVNKKRLKGKKFFSQGTYGMFKGDLFYIVGLMTKKDISGWEKFGFYMENIIMFIESMELNTCWIGGVFDRKGFGSEIDIQSDEIVPAIVPFGYAARKRSLRDKIVRWSAKGDKRKKAEELFVFSSSLNSVLETEKEELKDILENVRLAPSASTNRGE